MTVPPGDPEERTAASARARPRAVILVLPALATLVLS
jgi:hypothetical protein